VTNPNDIRAITKSLEGISSELEEEIKRLPPGVAMLVSPDIPRAVMVQVRVRRTKHGGTSKEISGDFEPELDEPEYEEEDEQAEEQPRPGIGGGLFKKIFGRG
jgi:uncharacterized protein